MPPELAEALPHGIDGASGEFLTVLQKGKLQAPVLWPLSINVSLWNAQVLPKVVTAGGHLKVNVWKADKSITLSGEL